MEKGVLILQNVTRERPGFVLDVLESRGVPYTKIDLSKGEDIPPFEGFDALVVLGGYDSANDQTHKIQNQIKRIEEWVETRKPYLGICLGLQLLVKAMGGNVVQLETREVGFRCHNDGLYELFLTEEGVADPLFNELPKRLHFFQLHEDTIELNHHTKLLATGSHSSNQVIVVNNNAYGLQCHFEINEKIFKEWLDEHPVLTKMDRTALEKDFVEFHDVHVDAGQKIFTNFLNIAKLI